MSDEVNSNGMFDNPEVQEAMADEGKVPDGGITIVYRSPETQPEEFPFSMYGPWHWQSWRHSQYEDGVNILVIKFVDGGGRYEIPESAIEKVIVRQNSQEYVDWKRKREAIDG